MLPSCLGRTGRGGHTYTVMHECTSAAMQVVTKSKRRPAPRPRTPSRPISVLLFSLLIIAGAAASSVSGRGGEFVREDEHDLSGGSSRQGAVITLITVIGRTSSEEARREFRPKDQQKVNAFDTVKWSLAVTSDAVTVQPSVSCCRSFVDAPSPEVSRHRPRLPTHDGAGEFRAWNERE
ncbi:hypothetical protein E2C01_046498 [Portunus trituberculatus]|uniref:Uncharacterized protein n=1 Tax=Portunus trituberculatus TaxID=210409 RepID=A0A5B7G7X3_PORTR|nr:hypothetical protein [Portunus trituberculatus]